MMSSLARKKEYFKENTINKRGENEKAINDFNDFVREPAILSRAALTLTLRRPEGSPQKGLPKRQRSLKGDFWS